MLTQDHLRYFAIKINGGSGCLIKSTSPDYDLVYTAKHIFFENYGKENQKEKKIEDIKFEQYLLNNNVMEIIELIPKDLYLHKIKEIDAAIVKINKVKIDIPFVTENPTIGEVNNCTLSGFPKYKMLDKSDNFFYPQKIEKFSLTANYGYIEADMASKGVDYESIVGFSGGGIIKIDGKYITIVGIQSDFPKGYGVVRFMPISFFEEIIQEYNLSSINESPIDDTFDGSKYLDINITVENEKIYLGEPKFELSEELEFTENDQNLKNIRIEQKVTEFYKKAFKNTDYLEKNLEDKDFNFFGEMLRKILFGKTENRVNTINRFINNAELNIENIKVIRYYISIIKEHDELKELPWEFSVFKNDFLSANTKYQLIRKTGNEKSFKPVISDLFIIVLKFKSEQNFEYGQYCKTIILDNLKYQEIITQIKGIIDEWEMQVKKKINYIIHFIGDNVPTFESDENEEDFDFISLFSKKLKPSLICFHNGESAKTGAYINGQSKIKNIAYEFSCQSNTPATVGFQYKLDAETTNEFYKNFYNNIKDGMDVGQAITESRVFLKDKQADENSAIPKYAFGSPVLFINTEVPISLVKRNNSNIVVNEQLPLNNESFFTNLPRGTPPQTLNKKLENTKETKSSPEEIDLASNKNPPNVRVK